MTKLNCWEFLKCGKELECPAGTFWEADGFCDGKNGGRGCVYITGTYCAGTIQGTYRKKEKHCNKCDFYKLVQKENPKDFSVLSFLRYVREHSSSK